MSTSRLPVALAIIGAFVAGIGVGSFVVTGPLNSARDRMNVARGGLFPNGSGSGKAAVKSFDEHQSGEAEELEGEELIKRIWTTLTLGDEDERHAAWLRLLPLLNQTDPVAVRELFRKMDAQGRRFDFEWFSFWPKWGEVDGPGALAYLADHESASWRPAAAEMLLRGWAKSDPNAARAWLSTNAASPFYEGALRGYLDGLARADLARATSEALVLGAGTDMSKLMEVLTEQALQQRQFDGMIEWWRTLPDDAADGSARKVAVEHIMARMQLQVPLWSEGDLKAYERAQAWMTELAVGPYRNDDQLGDVAQRVADWNPALAVEWISSLPPSPSDGHYTAIGRTMRAWVEEDSPAAEAWLTELSPSPLRDQAIVAYARALEGSQPDAARQWLTQVQDRSLLQQQQTPTVIYGGTMLRIRDAMGGTNLNRHFILDVAPTAN